MAGKCIVVCAGELRTNEIAVEEGDLVIAVDGGLGYCRSLKLEPDLIIGDFDSLDGPGAELLETAERQVPERVLRLPCEKDDTDTLAALKEGMRRGCTEFYLYAGTGGRFDHTLANLQCLLFLKNRGARGYLVEEEGMILVLKDEEMHFPEGTEGSLSLFAMAEEARGVTLEGMKYPLNKAVIRNDFPIGISNEFTGKPARAAVEDGTLALVLRCGRR